MTMEKVDDLNAPFFRTKVTPRHVLMKIGEALRIEDLSKRVRSVSRRRIGAGKLHTEKFFLNKSLVDTSSVAYTTQFCIEWNERPPDAPNSVVVKVEL